MDTLHMVIISYSMMDWRVCGVFSTRELAEEYCEANAGNTDGGVHEIEEWPLDDMDADPAP